ncbi:MAG: Trk system potassium transporter TrkA, partial [Methyloversatilis sp.]|nr:Trk system potassium transporter TrkA [Methyloversatilis sp.]
LIAFPEALQVIEFGKGRVSMVAVRAVGGGPLVGRQIKALREHLPDIDARIAAIYRRDTAIIPDGDTVIEPGDEVFCVAATEHIRAVTAELRRLDKPMRRIMIAGGGNIGYRLASSLENRYELKLIERSHTRAEFLSSSLQKTLVLAGDTTDEMLLEAENVDDMDLYLALTNDDENNIMSSLMAKRMGARRVVALINRRAYVDLVQAGAIDIAISPAQVSIGSLLAHVRRGDVVAVHSLRRGAAEALELVVHGDRKTSKVVGRRIDEIGLPEGAMIGAIVRHSDKPIRVSVSDLAVTETHDEVIIPHHDTVIEPEDHIIVFCSNKRLVARVERLFQVGFGFL